MGPSAGHLTTRVLQAFQEILYQTPNVNVTSSSRTSGDQVRANQAERSAMQAWEPYSHNRASLCLGSTNDEAFAFAGFSVWGASSIWLDVHPYIAVYSAGNSMKLNKSLNPMTRTFRLTALQIMRPTHSKTTARYQTLILA